MRNRHASAALAVIVGGLAAPLASECRADDSSFVGVCQNDAAKGAQVEEEKYCAFFRHYDNSPTKPLDTRVADALQIKSSRETRSIGLVIAISHYPQMQGNDLPAAAVDGKRMVDFLINTQQFDEVIALTDEDATFDTIRYFLQTYLPGRAREFNGKARLLIAYSGHGRPGGEINNTSKKPALILSAAKKMDADSGVYDMTQFYDDIKALAGTNAPESRARSAYHVMTLVNACFGGEVFTNGKPGGNADDFPNPGSYALTAGDDRHEVPSLIQSRGSLFFDLVIEGITSGHADPLYWEAYKTIDSSGAPSDPHGLTRSLALVSYLTGSYAKIASLHNHDNPPLTLSAPWFGPAQEDIARGGFFFLSDRTNAAPPNVAEIYKPGAGTAVAMFGEKGPKTAALTLPTGPISGLPGRPDVIVFKVPETYPIRGFDISSADGNIEWPTFRDATHPRFIYARAVGWAGSDPSFESRRAGAKSIGADFGPYVKFDFCRTPSAQLETMQRIIKKEDAAAMLPIAIELVHPFREDNHQLQCLNEVGLPAKKSAIVEFASGVREAYGKVPLLFGNRNNLSQLTDERSDQFMIWMGNYGVQNIKLSGRNPWTLWQYSGTLNVKGIGPNTTGDAFFGTEDQYNAFKTGAVNVARVSVTEGQELK